METEKFTAEQSLKLMEKTILEAKIRYYHNGFPLIWWGSLLALCFFLSYFTKEENTGKLLFIIAYFIGVIGTIVWIINFRKKNLTTKIDKQIGQLWSGYGMLILATFLTALLNENMAFYVPGTLLATTFTLYVMWFLLQFKPLLFGSIIFLIYALTFHITNKHLEGWFLASLAMILGYVVPGVMMWRRAKKLENHAI